MLTIRCAASRSHLPLSTLRPAAAPFAQHRLFSSSPPLDKEKLVILGSGWAGYNTARKLDKDLYDGKRN